jgi:precorrin-6B methylase 2
MQRAHDAASPTRHSSTAALRYESTLRPAEGNGITGPESGATLQSGSVSVAESAPRKHDHRGRIAREQMETILAHARLHGTDSAIDEVLGQTIHAANRESLREPTRVDWRLLLGMTCSDQVLNVGSGWGRVAVALAPWVGHLYSLEQAEQELEFQELMLEQRAVSNVTLLRGSILDLRCRNDTLDWVIFDGIFAATEGARDSRDTRAEMLARAFAALRPGGHVAICVANRWAVDTLRPSRNGLHEQASHRRYGGSVVAHTKLLARAGADEVRSYALLPHHAAPRAIIPIDPPCPPAAHEFVIDQVWRRASPAAALARGLLTILVRARVMRHFYPYYLLVGRKPC